MQFLGGSLYKTFAGFSVIGVFGLFVLGGLVRSTGSGMGCPDWPLCYGMLAPPLVEKDLPIDYQEVFNQQRLEKVDKLVRFLRSLGMDRQAKAIMLSPYLKNNHRFNVVKAYIEYINRLWGALVGLCVFVMLVLSLLGKKDQRTSLWWPISGFLLVIANGWIGSKVVDSNLLGGMVTFHFFFAMLALVSLIWSHPFQFNVTTKPKKNTIVLLSVVLFVQLLLGTWVREMVDLRHSEGVVFDLHAYKILGASFSYHRLGFAIVLLLSVLQFRMFGYQKKSVSFYILLLVIFQALNGSLNLFFDFPGFWQASHIFFAALLLSLQFYVLKSIVRQNA